MVRGTPSYRSTASLMRLKIGAATTPPYGDTRWGESTTTTMVKRGAREGTKPTNDAL